MVVPIIRLHINDFIKQCRGNIVLDVRSPAEYGHAHLPGAYNLPLFDNEERKKVGTLYKQQSREAAIKEGLDIFGPKMRKMVEEVEELIKNKSSSEQGKRVLYIYCWRGGMRSAGVAWLMDLYGFKVCTLAGGYKTFRHEVLQMFEKPYNFKILGGFTGSGKTRLLQQMKNLGENVIDLEQLACHRGSAFGGFNMPPRISQEMFENRLAMELLKIEDNSEAGEFIWMEDESQRIGDINISNTLWKRMQASPLIFLDIPFEERLNYIVKEYGVCPVEKLIESVVRIKKRLGGLTAKMTIQYLEEGNIKEAFRSLLLYYDKQYLKGQHNRSNLSALLTKVQAFEISDSNVFLLLSKIQL